MKLTQKESIKTELRLFNYNFSKYSDFNVLSGDVTHPGASDLDLTDMAFFGFGFARLQRGYDSSIARCDSTKSIWKNK
jgi:hypothetical protein